MYTKDTSINLFTTNYVISYGDYMIEFNVRTNSRTKMVSNEITDQQIFDDTASVFLLSGKTESYWEFDRFYSKNKIIEKGPWSEKKFGLKLTKAVKDSVFQTPTFYQIEKDTSINNITIYPINVRNKETIGDAVTQKLLTIKNKKMNSLYKIMGYGIPDKRYCMVGIIAVDESKKQGLIQTINDLRPLTQIEIKICESMVKKISDK
jgi:hypothetical protein